MKSARNTLPAKPDNGITCGIDWARDDHAVSIVDADGGEVMRCTINHGAAGLRELLTVLERAGAREVAIERCDGPVVQALLEAGITVVVISPNQVKNLRGRYGSAGNKDDRFDAFVLADTLRTDRARLHPLLPDAPATVALRQTCRARKDLVAHRVAVANQLRAHLMIVFPGAVGLFADLDSPISLAFLTRFDCQDRADWLSVARMANWLSSVGYSGRTHPRELHRRLTAAPRGATGISGAPITATFVAVLATVTAQIKVLDESVAEQLAQHADAHIFTSLPRSGAFRAARLLAEIGDCRGRFPTPESVSDTWRNVGHSTDMGGCPILKSCVRWGSIGWIAAADDIQSAAETSISRLSPGGRSLNVCVSGRRNHLRGNAPAKRPSIACLMQPSRVGTHASICRSAVCGTVR
jgi:transposase